MDQNRTTGPNGVERTAKAGLVIYTFLFFIHFTFHPDFATFIHMLVCKCLYIVFYYEIPDMET